MATASRGTTVPLGTLSPSATASTAPVPAPPVAASATPTSSAPTAGAPVASKSPGLEPPPVPIDARVQVVSGVTARIAYVQSVHGRVPGPGMVTANAVRVTLEITNGTATAISLRGVVASVSYGADRTPGLEMAGPGGSPFPAEVAGGGTATSVVVYSVPLAARDLVQIRLDFGVGIPVTVFEGAAPRP
jgi:hypothetical protein